MNAEILSNYKEDDFLKEVIKIARLEGWICFHDWSPRPRNVKIKGLKSALHQAVGTYEADDDDEGRANAPGLPDLILVHKETGSLVWAELKTNRGRMSAHQKKWRDCLQCGDHEWHLWRPRDWKDIKTRIEAH